MAFEIPVVSGTANGVDFRSLVYTASTHPQPDTSFSSGKPTSEKWSALIGTSHRSREVEDAIRAFHAVVLKRTVEEEEAEEREWESIVNKPQVRQVLRRMAAEARQQYYAGETEEGGFGLE